MCGIRNVRVSLIKKKKTSVMPNVRVVMPNVRVEALGYTFYVRVEALGYTLYATRKRLECG